MRIFRDTVCKQHEYQNMAPKNNPCGVSTLQKQKLLQPRPQGQAQPRTQGITFAHPLASGQSLSLRDFATDLGNN